MWRKLIIIAVVLGVIGAAAGGALYYVYPVQVSTLAGLTRNYVLSLGAPAGTTTTETNPDYKGAGAAGVTARRDDLDERCRGRLAELQPNRQLGPFLAAWRDHHGQCRELAVRRLKRPRHTSNHTENIASHGRPSRVPARRIAAVPIAMNGNAGSQNRRNHQSSKTR